MSREIWCQSYVTEGIRIEDPNPRSSRSKGSCRCSKEQGMPKHCMQRTAMLHCRERHHRFATSAFGALCQLGFPKCSYPMNFFDHGPSAPASRFSTPIPLGRSLQLITTLAPSLPKTPLSVGFGLLSRPFFLPRKANMPVGLALAPPIPSRPSTGIVAL
jgi:hypothetical protein